MPELGFHYELTRSDRRTLSIKISRDAKVLVYAPHRMSLKHIEDFLFEKRAWVLKNLAKVQERKDISDSFVPGGESGLLLLGCEYPLIKVPGKRAGFDGSSFFRPRRALGGGYGGSAQGSLPLARQELSRPQDI